MAKSTDTESIEGLLEQRAQFEQWLTKLDSAANTAPTNVRQKVRGDYEARLRGVIERLRGHSATIAGELERHQGERADLDGQRRSAEEELAEAELRHAVGEFTEEEWGRIRGESEGRLSGLRDQLRTVGGEIARLAEVQSLIAGPSKPPEPPPPPPAPAPRVEAIVERNPPPPPPPEPEPPVAAAPPPRQAAKPAPPPEDELAFLKSVADDDLKPAAAPSTRRPSNPGASQPAPRAVEAPPAPAPAATAPAPAAKSGAPGVAKTLKCGECGTLNRPTEWYCERCGAELAGI